MTESRNHEAATDRYLKDHDLAARYRVARGTVWRWVNIGHLPPPVRLGPAAARWSLRALEQWERKRAAGSGQ